MITLSDVDNSFTNTAVFGTIDPMPELDEMITTREAWELAKHKNVSISRAAISEAARRWAEDDLDTGIPGSIKIGNTWLIPRSAFIAWVDNRNPRGPKPGSKKRT